MQSGAHHGEGAGSRGRRRNRRLTIPFRLTSEVIALREHARRYALERLAPRAAEVDGAGGRFPRGLLREMAASGLLGLDIPVEYGGQGLEALPSCVILEELAAGWFSATSYAAAMSAGPILEAGTAAQKQRYLPGVARGELVSCFALTEPDAGSDAASLETHAHKANGGYVISGKKVMITNAHDADMVIVYTTTPGEKEAEKGVSVFIVEKGTKGMRLGRRFETLAHGANPIWEIIFEDCFVPAENLVGPLGRGFEYMKGGFSKTRAFYAARSIGVAQAALDYAARYAQGRKQFGQPLAGHQVIRFKLADMATSIEACRVLTYRAAALVDAGAPDAPVAAAMAKVMAADVAMRVTSEAIQVLGGYGYTRDHPLERYYREAKLFQIGEGSSEMMRQLISSDMNRRAKKGARVAVAD
jgi:alkylation response protein AidB-like acyl-CoA dehydrogenase